MLPIGRRLFCRIALGSMAAVGAARCSKRARAPFVLEETSIDAIQQAMDDGVLTARALCEQYLARITSLNPTLHAVIETNPDALAIAEALDRERRARGPRGRLHGIPMVVKDNIDTADRMQTTAGSSVFEGVPVVKDAFAIERLRAAGVVLLGKANLTEWAGGGGRNGYSARGGQTVNPYDTERTPLGSSSGSGVAVSANLATVAIGTETMGSILAPSSLLGVVGVKPTVGLISRTGVIPVALSMDSIGPMARTVRDAAHLLAVLAAPDPEDSVVPSRPLSADYVDALKPNLAELRIGVVREPAAATTIHALFERALTDLEKLGAQLVDPVALPDVSESRFGDHMEVMLTELKEQLPGYIASRRPGAAVRTLADVIDANRRGGIQQPPMELAQQKGTTAGEAYRRAFDHIRRNAREDGIDGAIRTHRVDAFVSPSIGPAWTFAEEEHLDVFLPRGIFLVSDAGYPAVTVPMGEVNNLPVGLLFFGAAWSESTLLRCAFAYEQKTHHRRPPARKA
jgi:amidase